MYQNDISNLIYDLRKDTVLEVKWDIQKTYLASISTCHKTHMQESNSFGIQ